LNPRIGSISRHFRVGPGLKPVRNLCKHHFFSIGPRNPNFEKILVQIKTYKKYPNPIPALPGHGYRNPGRHIVLSLYSIFQLSRCRNGERTGNRRQHGQTDRYFNRDIFLKKCPKIIFLYLWFFRKYY
jgi:hypothetical protein